MVSVHGDKDALAVLESYFSLQGNHLDHENTFQVYLTSHTQENIEFPESQLTGSKWNLYL